LNSDSTKREKKGEAGLQKRTTFQGKRKKEDGTTFETI